MKQSAPPRLAPYLEQAETSGGMGGNVEFVKVKRLFECIIVWVG